MKRAKRAPSVATCLVAIARSHAACRLRGLRHVVRTAQRQEVRSGVQPTADESALVEETARRVAVAAAFFPARALCLEQSLALCALLRDRGVDAALKIGVQPRPFVAHSWVEVAGRVANESAEVVRRFMPLPLEEA